MTGFHNPGVLLLLLPLLALLAGLAWTQADRRLGPAPVPSALPRTESVKSLLFRYLPFWVRVAAAALVILALARPQRASRGDIPPAEGIDIMLLLDTSGSMAAEDLTPTRLEADKAAATAFVKERRNDRIGVIVFGGAALLTCPLTLDYQSVLELLSSTYVNMTKADGTAIGDAIVTAVNHLKDSKAKSKVMILLTDGRSNTGLVTDTALAAKTAAAYDIKIYTIGTAGKGRAQIETGDPMQPVAYIDDDLDEPTLREISDLTGGEFYRATSAGELQEIYARINALEKTKFEVRTYTSYTDLYEYLLVPALLLLALLYVLERTYFRTIP
jgi:Ca-activated chloride channel family protein